MALVFADAKTAFAAMCRVLAFDDPELMVEELIRKLQAMNFEESEVK